MRKYVVLRSFKDKVENVKRKRGDIFSIEDEERAEYIESYSLNDPYVKRIDNLEDPGQTPEGDQDPGQTPEGDQDPGQTPKRGRKRK